MSNQVQFLLQAEEAQAVAAFLKVVDAQKQTEQQTTKVTKANRDLERAAKRVFDETRSPMERHNKQMADLNRLVESGKIDQDTYRRAVDRTNQELQETGRAGKQAFGGQALGQLKGMAAGVLSIGAAWGFAKSGLQAYRQEQDQAAQRDRESRRGLESLAQLADTQEGFAELTTAAREMFAQGGASSESEAARVIFDLKSAGLFDQRKLFTEMASTGLIDDPAGLAKAVSQLSSSMDPSETGSARDIINKAIGASGNALANVPELLAGAAGAGSQAKALGIGSSEVLAAVTALSGTTGSASVAGTQLQALLKTLDKRGGFRGKGLLQSVDEIAGLERSGGDVREVFGDNSEALNAYRLLAGGETRSLFRSTFGDMGRALKSDTLAQRLNLADTDPALRSARTRDLAEAQKLAEMQRELGGATNLLDAMDAERSKAMVRAQETPLTRLANQGMRGLDRLFWGAYGTPVDQLKYQLQTSLLPQSQFSMASNASVLRSNPDLQQQVAEFLGPKYVEMLESASRNMNEAAADMKESASKLDRAAERSARRPSTIATNQGE